MIKVIFTKSGKVSRFPIEYIVDTDNYKIAEETARIALDKDKPDNDCYYSVLMANIHILEPIR